MKFHQGFLITAGFVAILDQIIKAIIKSKLALGEKISLLSFLQLHHTTNTGAGFGIFQNMNMILIVVTAIVLLGILYYYEEHHKHWLVAYGSGLVFGGGLGNLIDRIYLGAVTDFIAIGWWPVFNIADTAICIGVIMLVVYFWKYN